MPPKKKIVIKKKTTESMEKPKKKKKIIIVKKKKLKIIESKPELDKILNSKLLIDVYDQLADDEQNHAKAYLRLEKFVLAEMKGATSTQEVLDKIKKMSFTEIYNKAK